MKVAVVIPCYRVGALVDPVIEGAARHADRVYVVDDACPEGVGDRVEARWGDRVTVLRNPRNLGVGGAVVHGYRRALEDGADAVVKIDGDGQMAPEFIPHLLRPIRARQADYTKGNRFGPRHRTRPRGGRPQPTVRFIGNSLLSFVHKTVSGYWNIVDPTNGFTAIQRCALESIDLDGVEHGYFFEHDMLFQLNLTNAVVKDVPIPAFYGDERSSLRVRKVLREFPRFLLHRFMKRILLKYFVHDFNVASLELLCAIPLLLWGIGFGLYRWTVGVLHDQPNTAGTVMLSALPIIIGFQLLLSVISFDVNSVPRAPLNREGCE